MRQFVDIMSAHEGEFMEELGNGKKTRGFPNDSGIPTLKTAFLMPFVLVTEWPVIGGVGVFLLFYGTEKGSKMLPFMLSGAVLLAGAAIARAVKKE